MISEKHSDQTEVFAHPTTFHPGDFNFNRYPKQILMHVCKFGLLVNTEYPKLVLALMSNKKIVEWMKEHLFDNEEEKCYCKLFVFIESYAEKQGVINVEHQNFWDEFVEFFMKLKKQMLPLEDSQLAKSREGARTTEGASFQTAAIAEGVGAEGGEKEENVAANTSTDYPIEATKMLKDFEKQVHLKVVSASQKKKEEKEKEKAFAECKSQENRSGSKKRRPEITKKSGTLRRTTFWI